MGYHPFREELASLPSSVQDVALEQIEEAVRLIIGRYEQSKHDYRINNFTKEEIAAMLTAPFEYARKFRFRND